MNHFESVDDKALKYAIHFADGSTRDCLTLGGAMRLIAYRHRVRSGELITETTEERISVWLYPGEIPIAEVCVLERDGCEDVLRV